MKTKQLNLRFPKELIEDISRISSILNMTKSEWIKTTLAKEVYENKKKLYSDLKDMYKKGLISKEKIKKYFGIEFLKNIENEKQS